MMCVDSQSSLQER
jgi:NAD(P)-dependent dehydrogenase (short-subunit alcohol dehydrogenase family)